MMDTTRKKDRIINRFSSDDVFLLGGVLYRICKVFRTVFDFHRSWTPVKDLDLFGRATKIHAAQKLLFEVSPETRNGTDGSDNPGRIYEVQLENQAHRIHGTNGIFTYMNGWNLWYINVGRKDTNPMDPIGRGLGFYFQFRFFRIFITGFALLSVRILSGWIARWLSRHICIYI